MVPGVRGCAALPCRLPRPCCSLRAALAESAAAAKGATATEGRRVPTAAEVCLLRTGTALLRFTRPLPFSRPKVGRASIACTQCPDEPTLPAGRAAPPSPPAPRTQGHTRRLHAQWDTPLASHALTDEAATALQAQDALRRGGSDALPRFSAPALSRAWAAMHDERRHAATTAALHALQLWVALAAGTPRRAATIDAAAAARALRDGVASYRAAARELDVQLRALQATCAAWRAREALNDAAARGVRSGSGGGAPRRRECARRSAGAFADAEAAQLGCGLPTAAAEYELNAPSVHARASARVGSRLGRAERLLLERACAASPLAERGGEGTRQLLAVHGSLLRYGAALDAAHDELARRPVWQQSQMP